MDRLIKTLPAILEASGGSEEVADAASKAAWKHAVGEALSSYAVPVQLQNKTLVIVVDDNIWKRQLEQMRGQLLFRLNSTLGQSLVKSIEVRIDPNELAKFRRTEEASGRRRQYLNAEVPAEILVAAGGISDADLRRAFLGAAMSCISRLEDTTFES